MNRVLLLVAVIAFASRSLAQPDDGTGQGGGSMPSRVDDRASIEQTDGWNGTNAVVASSGQLAVELTDQGLQVEQQLRLVNFGKSAHVFDSTQSFVALPNGYRAFEAAMQEASSGQRMVEVAGKGFRLVGSLPPGTMVIAWRFQLPLMTPRMSFSVTIPWEIVVFRAFMRALPGVGLDVDGMPKTQLQSQPGFSALATEIARKPSDKPFRTITIRLTGIPGANPLRWVALISSISIIALGALFARRTQQGRGRGGRI